MRKLLALLFAIAAAGSCFAGAAFAYKSPGHGTGSCGTASNGNSNVYHQGSFTTYDNGQGNGYSEYHGC